MSRARLDRMVIEDNDCALAPKPPGPTWTPKAQRFYNWGVDEKTNKPKPVKFRREVPVDSWHLGMAIDGAIKVVSPQEVVDLVYRAIADKENAKRAKIGKKPLPYEAQDKPEAKPQKSDKPAADKDKK